MDFLNSINNTSLKVIYDDLLDNYNEVIIESHLDDDEVKQKTKEIIKKMKIYKILITEA